MRLTVASVFLASLFPLVSFAQIPTGAPMPGVSSVSKISVKRTKFSVKNKAGVEVCSYEKPVFTHENKALEAKLQKQVDAVFGRPCDQYIQFDVDYVSEKFVSISFLAAINEPGVSDTLLVESALNLAIDPASGGVLALSTNPLDTSYLPSLKTYCKKYLEPEVTKSGYEYDLDTVCEISADTTYSFTKKGVKLLVLSNTGSMCCDRWFGVIVPYSSLSASKLLFGL